MGGVPRRPLIRLAAVLGLPPEDAPVVLGAVLLAAALLWRVAGIGLIASVCTTVGATAALVLLVRMIWRV